MTTSTWQPSGTPTFAELLRQHRIAAALSQQALAERAGLSERAISDLERAVKTHPYLTTVRMLADALNLTPPERAALIAAAKPDRSSARHDQLLLEPVALPIPPTALFGRDAEIGQIAELLTGPGTRILTLFGPGGVGKTRLALGVAERVQPHFPAGVVFVSLAPIEDPAMVAPALAKCLGLRNEQPELLHDRLAAFLRDKRLLLVVDNAEHLLPAMPQLAELVVQSEGARMLVTSRAVRHLSGELQHPVDPLPVPRPGSAVTLEQAGRSPAVQLFVARAASVRPDFALTEANAGDVAAVCARLDGLPLAIELAAARVRMLSPAGLLSRLDHVPSLLSTDSRDVTPRHRTFWDTVAWSHALLSEDEQKMFRRLAVFRDGWQLDAVEAVTDLGDLPNPIETLTGLVDKSLVQVSAGDGDEPRFRMLVPVREFATDQLKQCGEESEIRDRHAWFYTELAESVETSFWGPRELDWLDCADAELENFRAALTWGVIEDGSAESSMRLASALWWMWQTRFGMAEGRSWLERAMLKGQDAPLTVRLRTLAISGTIACFQGDFQASETWLKDALALSAGTDQAYHEAWARMWLGGTYLFQGKLEDSYSLLREALDLFEATGDVAWTAYSWFYMGVFHALTHDALQSSAYFQKALELFRKIEFASGIAATLGNMGAFELKLGDRRRAEAMLREALSMRFPLRDRWGIAQETRELAQVAALDRDAERGVRLLAASTALLDSLQTQPPESFLAYWQENEAWLRSMADDPAYAEAWHTGYTQPVEQAMAEAAALSQPARGPLGY
jgi:predicted ATPase/DNA-binding XRE family transcriptional regulator